jgi:AcrR family transcriptional regulator
VTAEPIPPTSLLTSRPGLTGARLRLFETALELFGERGYHAVSVRDIAQALGQQPGALYFHVQSKQQLLYEISLIGVEEHRDRVRDALLDAGREPVEQVRAMTRAHVLAHLDNTSLVRVASRENAVALDEEQLVVLLRVRDETVKLMSDVIDRGARLGVFNVVDTHLAVMAVGAMGIRAAEWWTPESPHTKEHVAETYAEFAVRLLSEPKVGE